VNELALLNSLILLLFALAIAAFALLLFVTAPYGRHARSGWGPTIADRLGWVLMEAPASLVFAVCFFLGEHTQTTPALIFFALWQAHYMHRAFIYPRGLRGAIRPMPIAIVASQFLFNSANAYVNGRYVFTLSDGYPETWLGDGRFVVGLVLFAWGFLIDRHSDRTLQLLRQPGGSGYGVPQGGLYRWVSSPNYLGEIVEWTGWALLTWSVAGLAFATWAAANLVPRARAHHIWYRERFPNYPQERKILFPGVW
jgi:protein-S-isoprenylcysteine O-methyltransferase Ste14